MAVKTIEELQKEKDLETLHFVKDLYYNEIKPLHDYNVELIRWIPTRDKDFKLKEKHQVEFVALSSGLKIFFAIDEENKKIFIILNPIDMFTIENLDELVEFNEHSSFVPPKGIYNKGQVAGSVVRLKEGKFATIDNKGNVWKD